MRTLLCFFLLSVLLYVTHGAPMESENMAVGKIDSALNTETNIEPNKKGKQVIKKRRKKISPDAQNVDENEFFFINGRLENGNVNSDLKQAIKNLKDKLVPYKDLLKNQANQSITTMNGEITKEKLNNNINVVIFNVLTDSNCTKTIEDVTNSVNISSISEMIKIPSQEKPLIENTNTNGEITEENKPLGILENINSILNQHLGLGTTSENIGSPSKVQEFTSNVTNETIVEPDNVAQVENIVNNATVDTSNSVENPVVDPTNNNNVSQAENIVNATLDTGNSIEKPVIPPHRPVRVTKAPAIDNVVKTTTKKIKVNVLPTKLPIFPKNKTQHNYNPWGNWYYEPDTKMAELSIENKDDWNNVNLHYRSKFGNNKVRRNDKYMRGGQQKRKSDKQ